MGACRENHDIWFQITNKYGSSKRILTRNFWHEYVWHDTIGRRWNKLIGCKVRGHAELKNISDPGEIDRWHCFDCEESFKENK